MTFRTGASALTPREARRLAHGQRDVISYGVRVLLATSGRRAACHAEIQTARDRMRLPRIVW
jgi:hypothetical protein